MVGGTLRDIRAEVRSLSCPDGDYEVLCGRSGTAPSATSGLSFPDRHAAGEAAELASEYRSVLRRYDPAAPYCDPLVHEASSSQIPPLATDAGDRRTRFTSFCHDVAGAVFESLSESGHREVESAAMETYLTLAEVVGDEDDYCLTMVWSLMSEMDVRLSADEQTAVVEQAASVFASERTPNPVGATLRNLESVGFLDGYTVRPLTGGESARSTAGEAARRWEVTFGDYALAERTGRIPTLPIAVDLLTRTPTRCVEFIDGEALSDARWRLRLQVSPEIPSDGLVSVDVAENRWLHDSGVTPSQENRE
ncbi:hypothetical protein GJR96_15220 [Haloferax sp. MBLA0076]|uniref:Uncharacterized protein n=1 Tax=Haloferax litoreum TaxID=2666140 RepID=A0A6A8GJE2_9EURY|nr:MULTISPECIES: hypothetical protein [Haloferax]KAB1194722.1 hypothetical protein Hfx1148_15150 [Haloferax sp. CBA1148]MRX23303.1 hypothetical protein [Haloferax litoreum]